MRAEQTLQNVYLLPSHTFWAYFPGIGWGQINIHIPVVNPPILFLDFFCRGRQADRRNQPPGIYSCSHYSVKVLECKHNIPYDISETNLLNCSDILFLFFKMFPMVFFLLLYVLFPGRNSREGKWLERAGTAVVLGSFSSHSSHIC